MARPSFTGSPISTVLLTADAVNALALRTDERKSAPFTASPSITAEKTSPVPLRSAPIFFSAQIACGLPGS